MRGLAILLVMLFHSVTFDPWTFVDRVAVKGIGFTWVGVDLFFALSGFLITGILFDSKGRSRYFSVFYARRALRIFPLYFAYLVGLAVYSWFIAANSEMSAVFRSSAGWYWSYGVNVLLALRGNWDIPSFHLWSLAVEEQFYLIWPLVVWSCGRTRLMQISAAAVVISLLLRIAFRVMGVGPIAAYVLLPTRMDVLLMGGLVALALRAPEAPTPRMVAFLKQVSVLGTALTLGAIILDKSTKSSGWAMQTLGFTGVGLLSSSLIFHCVTDGRRTLIRRLMESRWLRALGKYSYALYMFHLAAISAVTSVFPKIDSLPTIGGFLLPWALVRGACDTALALVLALLSWKFLERPALALKERIQYGGRASIGGRPVA